MVSTLVSEIRLHWLSLPGIMVHGHIHGSREDNERNAAEGVFRCDCGVDANDYAPVHIADMISFFELSGNSTL